ncbi:MAG: gas vesicle protein GvpN [Cyclobacteriaceae bacterium]
MANNLTLLAEADEEFVETPYIEEITERALNYIKAGFPVHFRGPAGTGKSTLAKHLASKLNRPISLIHGDEEMTSSNLVGGESGYRYKKVRDNFIASVLKEEETMTKQWVDNRLTEACKYGHTLIYDEFTRSRPEANNVLLSILQDKMLTLSNEGSGGNPYLEVSPAFNAIFTSNPEEYAGTFKSQDALRDRMVTLDLDYPDYETEASIVYAKARMPLDVCQLITKIVRSLRDSGQCEFSPTIRAGIMIAKTLTVMNMEPEDNISLFTTYCQDILASETSRLAKRTNQLEIKQLIKEIIDQHTTSNIRSFMAV